MFNYAREAFGFPDPRYADNNGVVAIGGDLRTDRLIVAYANGIFPWPMQNRPLTWFSPNPRMVLFPEKIRISRSLRKRIMRHEFEVRFDSDFPQVIRACAAVYRDGAGTWITPEMQKAYIKLHNLGIAHSVETWQNDVLVGGLYGISIGSMFCGESMFHRKNDASKVAFASLALQLIRWKFDLLDCQVYTAHLHSLGAIEIGRNYFLRKLHSSVRKPFKQQTWKFTEDPAEMLQKFRENQLS